MFVKLVLAGIMFFGSSAAVLAKEATPPGTTRKEKTETRQEFKTKMMKIRDEKKRMAVEKIDTKLNKLNKERTDVMRRHLNKMQELLTNKAKGDKAVAQAAIDTARAAVETQVAKEYVITITTEAKLKMDTEKVVKQLRVDLKAVEDLVTAARKAVAQTLGVEQ